MSTTLSRTTSRCLFLLLIAPLCSLAEADDVSLSESAKELSVAPLDHIEYPDSRPEWISSPPQSGEDAFRVVVVSGPCDTPEESLEELRLMRRVAVANLVTQILGTDRPLDFYDPTDQEIEEHLVTEQYAGEVTQGNHTRFEHAVEIEFSQDEQRLVRKAWQAGQVRHRLGALGVVTFSGLTLLVCTSALTGVFSRRAKRRQVSSADRSPGPAS